MILVGKELTDYLFLLFIIYIIYSTINSHRKYFLPRVEIKYCNIEIDRRNFYDQPINDLIKQDDEVRKISAGQDDDYTTGCLLDFLHILKTIAD